MIVQNPRVHRKLAIILIKTKQSSECAPLCADMLPSKPYTFLLLPTDKAAGQDDTADDGTLRIFVSCRGGKVTSDPCWAPP